ncbi:MAG: hypothetical protein R2697_14760 [Ilumatobacteraceae bacterium]
MAAPSLPDPNPDPSGQVSEVTPRTMVCAGQVSEVTPRNEALPSIT